MKRLEKLSDSTLLIVLISVAILTHLVLIPVGLFLHNSDQWIYPLAADYCLKGKCGIFPFDQGYGGMGISYVRALFVGIHDFFIRGGTAAHLRGHLIFSYLFVHPFMTLMFYWLLRKFCSRSAAAGIGILLAVGFQIFTDLRGIDFYTNILLISVLFLIWKTKLENPFCDLSRGGVFLAGLSAGISLMIFRGSALVLVPFFVPWSKVKNGFQRMRRPQTQLEKYLLVFSLSCLGLYFYLQAFGGDLGVFLGKNIRLHADPNLKLTGLGLGILFLLTHKKLFPKDFALRLSFLGAGLLLGVLPEVIYWIQVGSRPFSPPAPSLGESFQMVSVLIPSFKELMLGYANLEWPTPPRYNGIVQVAPLLLLVFSCFVLWSEWRSPTRKRPSLTPACVLLLLNLIAFVRVGMTGVAQTRYLFPMLPVLVVAFGLFWDRFIVQSKTRWKSRFAFLLIAGTALYQYAARMELVRGVEAREEIARYYRVIDEFQKMKVRIVLTNDRWGSNALTMASGEELYFVRRSGPWEPGFIKKWADRADHVGILLVGDLRPDRKGIYSQIGRRFKAKLRAEYGRYRLYEARAI